MSEEKIGQDNEECKNCKGAGCKQCSAEFLSEEEKKAITPSNILFPPEKTVEEMKIGDEVGFNCEGKHWTITRDE